MKWKRHIGQANWSRWQPDTSTGRRPNLICNFYEIIHSVLFIPSQRKCMRLASLLVLANSFWFDFPQLKLHISLTRSFFQMAFHCVLSLCVKACSISIQNSTLDEVNLNYCRTLFSSALLLLAGVNRFSRAGNKSLRNVCSNIQF